MGVYMATVWLPLTPEEKADKVYEAAVISHPHQPTLYALCRRLRESGCTVGHERYQSVKILTMPEPPK